MHLLICNMSIGHGVGGGGAILVVSHITNPRNKYMLELYQLSLDFYYMNC